MVWNNAITLALRNEKLLFVVHNGDKDFSQFLHKMKSNNEKLLSVAHNGDKDFSQFLHKIKIFHSFCIK